MPAPMFRAPKTVGTVPGAKFNAVNDAHRMMLTQVQRARPIKSTNQGVMIRCPFHPDKTPSLSINLVHGSKKPPGLWFCFGCGERGLWNKLAKKLGWPLVDEAAASRVSEFHGRKADPRLLSTDNLHEETVRHFDLDFVEPWPVDRKWRGFPGGYLNAVGCELAVDTRRKVECALLPVSVGGEPVGYVKANLAKVRNELSYVNSPGTWSQKQGLLGYDLAAKLIAAGATTVYVVEGPRDALRLLYYGVPAVAVLGAKVWSSAKRDLVLALGATHVVIFFDADTAGITATNMLRRSFAGFTQVTFVNVKRLEAQAVKDKLVPKGTKLDAANLPLPMFLTVVCRRVPSARPGGYRAALRPSP